MYSLWKFLTKYLTFLIVQLDFIITRAITNDKTCIFYTLVFVLVIHARAPRVTRITACSDRPPVCCDGTYMQRQLYTLYIREREVEWGKICAGAVYNVPAPMYYIRAEEWCNNEAASRSLPSVPETNALSKSHACLCAMGSHTTKLVSCCKCTTPYAILLSCAKK